MLFLLTHKEVNKTLQFCSSSVLHSVVLGGRRCEGKEGVLFWITVQYWPSCVSVLGCSSELPLFPCDVVETHLKMKGLFHDFLLLRINQSCYKLEWFVITLPGAVDWWGGVGSALDIPFTFQLSNRIIHRATLITVQVFYVRILFLRFKKSKKIGAKTSHLSTLSETGHAGI